MNASLVSECTISTVNHGSLVAKKTHTGDLRNGVHEGNIDFHSLSYQVFDLAKHSEVILGLDVFRVRGIETGYQSSEGGNAHTLTNAKNSWKDRGN